MRRVLAILLLGAALWQAWIDWQRTIGEGYAYRLTPIGQAAENTWPDRYPGIVEAWRESGIPFAWEPVGATLLSLPLALALVALAALLWLPRRRRRPA